MLLTAHKGNAPLQHKEPVLTFSENQHDEEDLGQEPLEALHVFECTKTVDARNGNVDPGQIPSNAFLGQRVQLTLAQRRRRTFGARERTNSSLNTGHNTNYRPIGATFPRKTKRIAAHFLCFHVRHVCWPKNAWRWLVPVTLSLVTAISTCKQTMQNTQYSTITALRSIKNP